MIDVLLELLILVLIFGVLYWAIGQIPLPKPARTAANVVLAIILIVLLASLLGWGPWWHAHLPRRW